MSIYTNQYDLFADLPQYVANPVADLNAFAGLIVGQHNYFPHAETWIHTGTLGDTNFYYALDQGPLPITDLVRMPLAGVGLPGWGNTIGDFLQPDLRVLSDLGYGSPFNNAPTEASLLEFPNWPVVGSDLAVGTVQGFDAAGVDLGLLPQSNFPTAYPYVPTLNPNLNLAWNSPVTGLGLAFGVEGDLMQILGLEQ